MTPSVISLSAEGRMVRATTDLVWCVGRRPVNEIRLASGRTIRGTANHRLYGLMGWTRVEDLKVGDSLAVACRAAPVAVGAQTQTTVMNDMSWDRIAKIEFAGIDEVYDLTVPGPASWLADGIVSHNSGEIEQVSDLVLFLYREDYYDIEKAQKDNKENICEVIIAKHRNGPIGTVELYFHKEYSRFANLEKRR